MKSTHILLAAALAIAIPASVHAKDPANKAGKEDKKAARQAISQYDKNGNGKIDADEADALKTAFENDKTGPLKQFDTNNDGKLDDTEIAAIHGKGAKGEKKKNK